MIQRSESEIAILAQFTAKEGKRDELLAGIYEVWGHTLAEPGCKRFVLYQSVDNPNLFSVIEKFASQEAFDAHVAQPYTQKLLNVIVPEASEPPNITFHKEILAPVPVKA